MYNFIWDVDTLHYYFEPDSSENLWGTDPEGERWEEASSAVTAWAPYQGRFLMTEVFNEQEANIVFRPIGFPNDIARGLSNVLHKFGYLDEDDVITIYINDSDYLYQNYFQFSGGLRTVISHEVGHALSLAHTNIGWSTLNPEGFPIMFIGGHPADGLNRIITGHDIQCLQNKYGNPGAAPGFVYIPPGTFQMGSPTDEPGRNSNEFQHSVTLTQGFYMSQYEVTEEWWHDVMGWG